MDHIRQIIFIVSFFALCITAQYTPPIPCANEESCLRVLGSDQDPKCVGAVCLCRNSTKLYRLCSSKDLLGGARQGSLGRGLGRSCNSSADCQRIEGADCRQDPGNPRQGICTCRPGAVPSPDGQRCLPAAPGGGPYDGPRNGPMDGPRNGPMDGPRNGPMDGPRNGPIDGPRNGPMERSRNGPMDGSRNGPMDGSRNGPMDGPRNGPFDGPHNGPYEDPRNTGHPDHRDGQCTEDSQCSMRIAGSSCSPEGRCRCHDGYHEAYTVGKCVPNKGYGERCIREDESCYQPAGPNNANALECSDYVCKCARNYILRDGICQSSDGSQTTVPILLLTIAFFTVKLF